MARILSGSGLYSVLRCTSRSAVHYSKLHLTGAACNDSYSEVVNRVADRFGLSPKGQTLNLFRAIRNCDSTLENCHGSGLLLHMGL